MLRIQADGQARIQTRQTALVYILQERLRARKVYRSVFRLSHVLFGRCLTDTPLFQGHHRQPHGAGHQTTICLL